MTTASERLERKRITYKRRLREVRERYKLPALSLAQQSQLVERLLKVRGDGVCCMDLRRLTALTLRGFFE